ncbi:hypothetical protein AB0D46_15875 [Streptomyces sp. NPDC048383]|uniref:hypothetical protein n=1 Tax=Streptomyces sp. NPDC048383 TaxID=3155386 RepID=UPI003424B0E4
MEALEYTDVAKRLLDGWSKEDPLLAVNFNALAREAGHARFNGHWMPALRPLMEQAAASLGVKPRWGRGATAVPRADGAGEVAWTEGVTGTCR